MQLFRRTSPHVRGGFRRLYLWARQRALFRRMMCNSCPIRIASLIALQAAVGCSNVKNVQLGQAAPPFGPFGPPHALAELGSCQNPTLTADLLEIYITTDRAGGMGNNDTWVAKRTSLDAPFDAPAPVPNVNSASEESSPAVSLDGLTLWFASDRSGGTGGMDIWVSTRSSRQTGWSTPTPVTALDSPEDEISRPVGYHGLEMPLSRHGTSGNYQLYMANRPSITADWQPPQPIVELAQPSVLVVDGFSHRRRHDAFIQCRATGQSAKRNASCVAANC